MSAAEEEYVMAVPAKLLHAPIEKRGLITDPSVAIACAYIDSYHVFIPRTYAETTKQFRQVIPYTALRYEHSEGIRYFLTRRTRAQSEQRLHNKYSLGIGGHVSTDDATTVEAIRNTSALAQLRERTPHVFDINPVVAYAYQRELAEEMTMTGDFGDAIHRVAGIILLDEPEVSAMHLGIVVIVDTPFMEMFAIRETENMTGWWATLEEIVSVQDAMESWSAATAEFILTSEYSRAIATAEDTRGATHDTALTRAAEIARLYERWIKKDHVVVG